MIKKKILKCMTLNNINNHPPHVHFINTNSLFVLTLWKWGETSSTSSLPLIRTSSTSSFRNGSVFTSSGSILCSNEEWFRNVSGITTARQSKSSSDVTRLVATEHVRIKYSLLKSIPWNQSTYVQHQFNSNLKLNCTPSSQSPSDFIGKRWIYIE